MSERRHDLDWLRLIAIVLLHVFHTGMLYNSWGWHIKSPVTSAAFEPPMAWLHYWRMPLLFFVSGAGTWYALRRRSGWQYAGERARRLLIPLVFGMLVVVPPQIYFERIDQWSSYWEFWRSVFEFEPYPVGGSLSWHHLWFVLYLFLMSVLALPVLLAWREGGARKWKDRLVRLMDRPLGMAWWLVPLLGSQFLLRPFFPEFSNGTLVDDWGAFAFYGLIFLAGYLFLAEPRLWEMLRRRRRTHLIVALLAVPAFFVARYVPYPWGFYRFDFIYFTPTAIMCWFTVLAVLGYGQRYLNRPSRVLSYANEALYPFYILHQTMIIVIGWYAMPYVPGVVLGYLTVFVLSGAASLGIYHFLIRPIVILRPLFGMKLRRRRVDAPTAASGHSGPVSLSEG